MHVHKIIYFVYMFNVCILARTFTAYTHMNAHSCYSAHTANALYMFSVCRLACTFTAYTHMNAHSTYSAHTQQMLCVHTFSMCIHTAYIMHVHKIIDFVYVFNV